MIVKAYKYDEKFLIESLKDVLRTAPENEEYVCCINGVECFMCHSYTLIHDAEEYLRRNYISEESTKTRSNTE